MIKIDKKKCIKCGACAEACPALVIENLESGANPTYMKSCIKCYHCVAICPTAAVTCDEFKLDEFRPAGEFKTIASPAAIRNMIAMRRSVREFKDKEVPRELLEELAATASLAPTGTNAQGVKLSIVTDKKTIDKLDNRVAKTLDAMTSLLANPVGDTLIRAFSGKEMAEKLSNSREGMERYKTGEGLKRKRIFRGAPVLISAYSGPEQMAGKDDAVIALTQMAMLAQAHGLGATWLGLLVGATKIDPTIKKQIGISLTENLHSAMILGWPKYKYKRAIPRKQIPVKWI